MSETEMHYSEALDWISALEWWVRQQGLEVPTWHDMELSGWPGRATIELTSAKEKVHNGSQEG